MLAQSIDGFYIVFFHTKQNPFETEVLTHKFFSDFDQYFFYKGFKVTV